MTKEKAKCCKNFLKLDRDDASFPSAERPFQILASLKYKHIWSVFKFFFGSLKSFGVFLKHFEVSWDALVKRLHKY